MAGKKYQSCLTAYENEIIALRRKRPPTPYSQIAELLREKYQLTVRRETIHNFLKVRAKGFKSCPYAWSINADNATETPQKQTASKPKVSAIKGKPAVSSFDPSKVEITEYSPTWKLHRPKTEEEREAYRQHLREEKRKLEHQ
jgi:hypothetical protein